VNYKTFVTRSFTSCLLGLVVVFGISGPAQATVALTNGVYNVTIYEGTDGSSFGIWTATTGPAHPAGGDLALLYPLGTSYASVRNFTTGNTYSYPGAGTTITLDPFLVAEGDSAFAPVGQGWSQTWDVTPEGLSITQDVFITGANISNSAIYQTVELSNTGDGPILLGWRNEYDWAVNDPGFDDGPSNAVETVGSVVVPATTIEFSHTPAAGEFVRIAADPGTSLYEPLLSIGFEPGLVPGLPVTVPTEYAYASYGGAYSSGFDYTVGGIDVTGDSAGLSWFGRDQGSAIEVLPGESVRVTQVLFGALPDAPPLAGVSPVPTMSQWSMTILAGLLLLLAFFVFRQRQYGRR
jgi:hypothetical protein